MTPRSTGIMRSACSALFSFSEANIRLSPSVPENANATHRTPGTAARIVSRSDSIAKLNTTRTTTPKKSIALSESLVRSSIRRSLRKIVQTLRSMTRRLPVAILKIVEAHAVAFEVERHSTALQHEEPAGQLVAERHVVDRHDAR